MKFDLASSVQLRLACKRRNPRSKFFEPHTMDCFGSEVVFAIKAENDEYYFVTVEKRPLEPRPTRNFEIGYTVRKMDLDGEVESLTKFMEINSESKARKALYKELKKLDPNFDEDNLTQQFGDEGA